jgi:hypothetical protein
MAAKQNRLSPIPEHPPILPPAAKRARRQPQKRLLARGAGTDAPTIPLQLSMPEAGEECPVTCEAIADYQLEFLPCEPRQCVIPSQPQLTKATLPCGHSFSALAIVYHFAKNCMQCPCCRAGHDSLMALQSVPVHLRKGFKRHLDQQREEDRREQASADLQAATQLFESEVTEGGPHSPSVIYLNRVLVIAYAYDSMESVSPRSVQAVPLPLTRERDGREDGWRSRSGSSASPSSTRGEETLAFESSGYSCRQINHNLRAMGVDAAAYELVVATRDIDDGLVLLCRSQRFEADNREDVRLVPAQASAVDDSRLKVLCNGSIQRVGWSVPTHSFIRLLLAAERV